MIIVDTREKKISHILKQFTECGEDFVIKTIDTADFYEESNPLLRIDRKQNLNEIASNLCTKDRERFRRECQRAKDKGIKIIFLIESSGYSTLEDVKRWQSPFSKINGKYLFSEMRKIQIVYKHEFKFCSKANTGRTIISILRGGDDDKRTD